MTTNNQQNVFANPLFDSNSEISIKAPQNTYQVLKKNGSILNIYARSIQIQGEFIIFYQTFIYINKQNPEKRAKEQRPFFLLQQNEVLSIKMLNSNNIKLGEYIHVVNEQNNILDKTDLTNTKTTIDLNIKIENHSDKSISSEIKRYNEDKIEQSHEKRIDSILKEDNHLSDVLNIETPEIKLNNTASDKNEEHNHEMEDHHSEEDYDYLNHDTDGDLQSLLNNLGIDNTDTDTKDIYADDADDEVDEVDDDDDWKESKEILSENHFDYSKEKIADEKRESKSKLPQLDELVNISKEGESEKKHIGVSDNQKNNNLDDLNLALLTNNFNFLDFFSNEAKDNQVISSEDDEAQKNNEMMRIQQLLDENIEHNESNNQNDEDTIDTILENKIIEILPIYLKKINWNKNTTSRFFINDFTAYFNAEFMNDDETTKIGADDLSFIIINLLIKRKIDYTLLKNDKIQEQMNKYKPLILQLWQTDENLPKLLNQVQINYQDLRSLKINMIDLAIWLIKNNQLKIPT